MSTPIPIVPIPEVVLASEFPSLADRPAGTYNQKAKAFADSANPMSLRNREIAVAGRQNALASREAADEAISVAVPAAATAVAARDKALEYKSSAEAAAAAAGAGAGLPSLAGNAGKALVVGPDEDAVAWNDLNPAIGVRLVTSAATLGMPDISKMIRCTGTFTLSFAALATLAPGWFCYIKNAGSGDITLDPSGSQQIDGRTSYIMYPGECRLVTHDGAAFVSVVLNGFFKTFTSSGTFIKPPGYQLFKGFLWGAGAAGNTSTSDNCRGGPGGMCFPLDLSDSAVPNTVAFTIGAGGAPSGAANITPGGNSQFMSFIAYGGQASGNGGGLPWQSPGLNDAPRGIMGGGRFLSGFVATHFMSGDYGGAASRPSTTEDGANSIWGGAAGSSGQPASAGGTSIFGGDGGGPAQAGSAPGGGGGAFLGAVGLGGAGARGELRIRGEL